MFTFCSFYDTCLPEICYLFFVFLQINRLQLLQSKCVFVFSGPAPAAAAVVMWCLTTWLPCPQILLSCVSNTAERSGINSERSVKSHTECLGLKKPFYFFYVHVLCFPSVKSEAMSQTQVFGVSRHKSPFLRVKIGPWSPKILRFMHIWLHTCSIMTF